MKYNVLILLSFRLFDKFEELENQKSLITDSLEIIKNSNSKLSYDELLEQNRQLKHQIQEIQKILKKSGSILSHREAKYRALYENAPLSYQSLDVEGYFIDINPAWLSTLGYSWEEVIGKNYADFLHSDWKSIFEKNFAEFKRRGYVSDVQFKIKHKKGHFIDISLEGYIGTHPDGSFKQTYCVFKDITEQKRVEDALIKNQFYLSKAQEIGKIGTWELDILNNKLYWTKQNYKNFGLSHKTSLNYEVFLNCIHPDDRDYVNRE
ncbi:PAS domain-containing protein [Draconibacterium halophilum]|uniref:histidine kinase n=1 Tax=Draconibacterium halophilum TaxID=2706887 RepID=A0A6C0R870_9BACT|nr:PAS domain S-box protein [Draconibacterium halophilum]QIA06420.1 PAS domain S-box protein [Draconibacterium halophilum]